MPVCARAHDKRLSFTLHHFILGLVSEDSGELDNAIQEYKKALKADSRATAIHLHMAATLIKKNDFEGAVHELNQVVGLEPEAVEPHAILALLYSSQNKPDQATKEYEFALKNASKLDPTNVEVYRSLGLIYFKQKRLKEAEETYRHILEINGKDTEAHYGLANIYYERNDMPAVERELRATLEIKPDHDEALNFLGYLYVEQDRNLDTAETMIRKALQIVPRNGAYLDSLGWLHFKKRKFQEAVKEIEQAAGLIDDPIVFDHLGDVYLKTGQSPKAHAAWEKSLTLDPSQEKVKSKLKLNAVK